MQGPTTPLKAGDERVSLDGAVGAGIVYVSALALFALQSLAVSLVLGRDSEDYVIHGWELFEREPLFPTLMVARTPVAGVVIDTFYAVGGAIGLEIGLGLLFAGAVTGWVAAARQWGRKPAVAMFVLLAVVPAYGLFFHRVSSDPMFAAVLALVAYLAVRMARRPSVACAFALGASVALLILTRPSGQPFLILALLPLGVALPWPKRIRLSLVVAVAALVLVAGWAVSNQVRYGERTVAHGGKSGIPLYRVFVIDSRVDAANGPATRAVARAAQKRLLTIEPYRSYGFDVDELLAARSVWVLDDLVHAVEGSEYGPVRGADLLFARGSRASVRRLRRTPAASGSGSWASFCSRTAPGWRAAGRAARPVRSRTRQSARRHDPEAPERCRRADVGVGAGDRQVLGPGVERSVPRGWWTGAPR